MAKKRGRPKKVKPASKAKVKQVANYPAFVKLPEVVEAPAPELIAAPQVEVIQDRMARYGYQKPRVCPECRAMPVVTMLKRRDYALYRCRECGHKWEIGI